MPRGRGRGRAAAKRKAASDDDEAQPKVQREDSNNTKKPGRCKVDAILCNIYPNAVVHENYSCMLNQTNIDQNKNKFYIIQLTVVNPIFHVFTRWGRVGQEGQNSIDAYNNEEEAVKAFEKKFHDKTKNNWADRENFQPVPDKYTLTQIDEESDVEDVPCSLHPRTQLMIKLIFSDYMFTDHMDRMSINVKKLPLGKLNNTLIAKALETLLDIEDAIKTNKPQKTLKDLSSQFFALVPHKVGRGCLMVLDSDFYVHTKREAVLMLSDIELVLSLQKAHEPKGVHPLQEKYDMLDCDLEYIERESAEFQLLNEYATACPRTRRGPLLDAWRVDRKGERERFSAHDAIEQRKLLWQGVRLATVAAILKAGLRTWPFPWGIRGAGINLASEHAKSSQHVGDIFEFEGERNVGFMFLVEAALGKQSSIKHNEGSFTEAPEGYDSIVARGRCEPNPENDKKVVLDGKDVIVPVGSPIYQTEWADSTFSQSEYLIFNESQARIRYLLKFSFD